MNDVETIIEGGAYYHASVFLKRYIKYLFKFSGLVIGFSIILGVIGWYAFEYLPSDILFSLFMIISLILIIFISRKTLTADAKKEILIEERKKAEKELIKSHSKYA